MFWGSVRRTNNEVEKGFIMIIGADSLMATVDMNKLLNKETLEKGRVISNKDKVELQDKESVINEISL